jgi:hypothetical protein
MGDTPVAASTAGVGEVASNDVEAVGDVLLVDHVSMTVGELLSVDTVTFRKKGQAVGALRV